MVYFFGKVALEMRIVVASIMLSAVFAVSGVAREYATWGLPEGAKLRIGRGTMYDLAYSPDGSRIAIASSIGIWLYDTATLEEVDLLTEHTREVTSVVYSPDGSMLASGSEDKTVCVRDVKSGEQKFPPLLHKHAVDSVKFSPDAALLASMSSREVQIWDAKTGAKRHTLTGHTQAATSIAFSPDGSALVAGSEDRTMRIWDAATGELLRTISTDVHSVNSLAFSPDGETIVTGVSGGIGAALCLWDTATGDLLWTRTRNFNSAPSVEFGPGGARISAGSSGGITLLDSESGRLQQRLIGPSGGMTGVVFSPDGGTIASASGDNILRFWDAESGVQLRSLAWMETGSGYVTFSPDGRILAVRSGRNIRLWDAESGEDVRTLRDQAHEAQRLAFNWDRSLLASGGIQKVLLWDITTGKLLRTLSQHHGKNVLSLAFSPVGRTLAAGIGRDILLWDTNSGELLRTLSGHEYGIANLAFSRDGSLIVSNGRREILLWEFKTGRKLKTLIGFENNEVKGVAFSGDGKTLYCATSQELRHWDIDTGEYRGITIWQNSGAAGAAFSPDGGLLARWNRREIELWNVARYDTLETLAVDSSKINYTAFSSDGRTLATAGNTGSVLLWDIRPPSEADSTVRLVPSSMPSPSVGEQLTFHLEVENGENVSAYQATVNFDTSALRYVKSAAGDYLPEGAFFVPPAIDGHRLTVGAVSLGGTSHGNGTLPVLSFEVLAAKNSTVTLSEVSLVDPDAKQSFPRIEDARVEVPSRVVVDANGDGVIGILDLPQVAIGRHWTGQIDADVNEDGVVDTADLFQAVTDLEIAKKEPAAYLAAQAILTSRDVSEWLGQPRKSNLAEADLKRSIRAVRHRLAVSVPGETALLPNYPNPFDQGTWIPYHLAVKAEVYITIYGEKGLPVRHLALGNRIPGYYVGLSRAAYWDGRDDSGVQVASGTYVYELVTWDCMATRKMRKVAE